MAKFKAAARATSALKDHPDATVNHEGGLAFKVDPKTELYLRAAATLCGEPKYYDGEKKGDLEDIPRLIAEVAKEDPEFILQLAAYCRNDLYLRSIPVLLLVEACKDEKSRAFVRKYTPSIVQRADELVEVVACYISRNTHIGNKAKKGMLSNPLKRGLADAFHNFNAYSFAKYDREGSVKLSDVIRVVHPKPKDDKEALLFKQVRERTLPVPETWETVISTKGSTKEAWESILPKMPFMARLRNIRNLLDKGVDLAPVISMLEDKKAVLSSKQFPYRFLSAYKEIEGRTDTKDGRKVLEALATAMELSVENIPELKGTTFIATDNSGSMRSPISGKSKMMMVEVGAVLGAMARRISDDAIVGVFGDNFATVHLSERDSILTNAKKLYSTDVGCSTNAWLSVDYLVQEKVKVDRIIIFSDMQCYDTESVRTKIAGWASSGLIPSPRGDMSLAGSVAKYRASVNPNVTVFSFDLQGHGTSQFPEDQPRTALLAGWSDRVLHFLPRFEAGGSAVEEIKKVTHETFKRKVKVEEKVEGKADEDASP